MAEEDRLFILVLNWNGWQDTLECLESVFRSNYANFKVVVCDNDSSDDSFNKIKAWADGTLELNTAGGDLHYLSSPPVGKSIQYTTYTKTEVEQSDFLDYTNAALILIQNGENLGFAGGNNVAIKFALKHGATHVWILNNDTVVDPQAARELIEACESGPDVGFVGSKVLLYGTPSTIWCIGADIDWHIGNPRILGYLHPDDGAFDEMTEMETISGCSMLVKRDVLERIGLMDERFFLYFEETDWIERARRHGYKTLYTPSARIFQVPQQNLWVT